MNAESIDPKGARELPAGGADQPAVTLRLSGDDGFTKGLITRVTDQDYDGAAFARALGLDPQQITAEGIEVTFVAQIAIARWSGFKRFEPGQVLAALSASVRDPDQDGVVEGAGASRG